MRYKCYLCNKEFTNRHALAGHISHHSRTQKDYDLKGIHTSKTMLKRYASGEINRGPYTTETRNKISISKLGIKNPNYKNGVSIMLKNIIADKKECLVCGSTKILCVHHIDRNNENNAENNLVVLCKHCHDKLHQRGYNFRNEEWSVQINEFFTSIQCEGKNVGVASHFIRLAGCSIKCAWCDSKSAWGASKGYFYNDVLDIFNQFILKHPNVTNLVITGGEPLEQNYYPIVLFAKIFGFTVEVETSGSPLLQNSLKSRMYNEVDLYNISPKLWIDNFGKKFTRQKVAFLLHHYVSIFKFVIDSDADFDKVNAFITRHKIPESKIYIQCQFENKSMMEKCIEHIKDSGRKRLSIQLHKLINIR